MGNLTVVRGRLDFTALAECLHSKSDARAGDQDLASATVRTALIAPEPDWWRQQMLADQARARARHHAPVPLQPAPERPMPDSAQNVLGFLNARGPHTCYEIYTAIGVHRATATRGLSWLARHQMITTVEDRRGPGGHHLKVYAVAPRGTEAAS